MSRTYIPTISVTAEMTRKITAALQPAYEIRAILTETVLPPERVELGTRLAEIWAADPLTEEEHALLNNRDRTPHEPMSLDE
ncbi:hypothetical protein ACIBEK_08655 [Nocardia fusca]|uniref:hypothetical protein n=1 Tax=Nocardia fusca TaxID=941183 RepID=UPI0037A0A484